MSRVFVTLIALIAAGCGGSDVTPRAPSRTFDVPWGGTIAVERVARVVPANATAVDIVTNLVPPERVAALPTTAFVYSGLSESPGPWADLPRFERYEAEALLALAPDLVLCDALQADATTDVLRAAGVPVLRAPREEGWDAIEAYVEFVAQLLDVAPTGRALIDDLRARRELLADAAAARPEWTAVTYTNSGTGGWTAGAGTSADVLLASVGLVNEAARRGVDGHARLDFETLLTWDPDVIVVSRSLDGASSPTAALLRAEPALASLTAVRRDRIVDLPAALYGTVSQRLVDAAERLSAALDALPTTSSR